MSPFTGLTLPATPRISNGNVVFWGGGGGIHQGIYASLYGALVRVADATTSISGGDGSFSVGR